MGKNLKGKECGKGIYQRKDGLYSARYYAKNGKRKEKYFETLPEAKNWLARLLNISDNQLSYISGVDFGHGLLKCGSTIVPFMDHFPKNGSLYQLMTTKMSERVEQAS